jgi:hypothetical protein
MMQAKTQFKETMDEVLSCLPLEVDSQDVAMTLNVIYEALRTTFDIARETNANE